MDGVAVVVGGGIGGLAAAVALGQHGWRVTVLERAPELTEVGAGLTLWSNALAGLDAIGVGRAVRDTGSINASAGTRLPDGTWLTRVAAGRLQEEMGLEAVAIHRATLLDLLHAALPEQSLVTGAEVVDVRPSAPSGPRAVVTYRAGQETVEVEADVVVAADGINSSVRRALWPDPSGPRYSGVTAWRAVTPQAWTGELTAGMTWAPGTEVGVVPLGDGRVYWFVAVNAPEGGSDADELGELRRRYGHWHSPIPELMAATPPEAVLRNDIYELAPPLAGYRHGRVVLLGDAAHAMVPHLGQGACQAIEDAVVLGGLLAGAPADGDGLDDALAEYDRLRRPRSQWVARQSRLASRVGQRLENPLAVGARNRLLRVLPSRVALGAMARAAAWRP